MSPTRWIPPAIAMAVALTAAGPAAACLWDRDTLAHEARGIPDVIQVVTGRFERNPPLYYQMRLERVQNELRSSPSNLELYDDAAVACDRLGRDDEAIKWMQRKRDAFRAAAGGASNDHKYRLHANLGTFYAHKWLRDGGHAHESRLLDRAVEELQAALEINPEAHFGRERYQLWIIEALRDRAKTPKPQDELLGNILQSNARADVRRAGARVVGDTGDKLVKGLSGLVALGNAWESPDVFEALSKALAVQRLGVVSYMALLRCSELLDSGHQSLFRPELKQIIPSLKQSTMAARDIQPLLDSQYKRLRFEADGYQARRAAYMLARLQHGRHPDTDRGFWSEWRDPGPPSLHPDGMESAKLWLRSPNGMAAILFGAISLVALSLLALAWFIHVRRVRRAINSINRPLGPA